MHVAFKEQALPPSHSLTSTHVVLLSIDISAIYPPAQEQFIHDKLPSGEISPPGHGVQVGRDSTDSQK